MEENKPENPPAFPAINNETAFYERGLSMRDYFAAKAMQQILPIYESKGGNWHQDRRLNWESDDGNPDAIAELSYQMADAMLKARQSKD
jgi:hypothetical protein